MSETNPYLPSQQTRHSHPGLWLAIGIMAAVALFSLLLAAGFWLGLNKVKESGPTSARFYMALHDQNYALAYTYLDSTAKINNQTLDQATFIGQAAQADSRQSAITGFNLNDKGDTAHTIAKVSRGTLSYDVHLEFKQIDGRWLITSIDRL